MKPHSLVARLHKGESYAFALAVGAGDSDSDHHSNRAIQPFLIEGSPHVFTYVGVAQDSSHSSRCATSVSHSAGMLVIGPTRVNGAAGGAAPVHSPCQPTTSSQAQCGPSHGVNLGNGGDSRRLATGAPDASRPPLMLPPCRNPRRPGLRTPTLEARARLRAPRITAEPPPGSAPRS